MVGMVGMVAVLWLLPTRQLARCESWAGGACMVGSEGGMGKGVAGMAVGEGMFY
jgi:hypothetical protein